MCLDAVKIFARERPHESCFMTATLRVIDLELLMMCGRLNHTGEALAIEFKGKGVSVWILGCLFQSEETTKMINSFWHEAQSDNVDKVNGYHHKNKHPKANCVPPE